jgi:hypothetical protein
MGSAADKPADADLLGLMGSAADKPADADLLGEKNIVQWLISSAN